MRTGVSVRTDGRNTLKHKSFFVQLSEEYLQLRFKKRILMGGGSFMYF